MQASRGDFAAILRDRSVMTWGHAACGGDSSAVEEHCAADPNLFWFVHLSLNPKP